MNRLKEYYLHTKGIISLIVYTAFYSAFLKIYTDNPNDRFLKGMAFAGMIVSGIMMLRALKRMLQKKYKKFLRKFDENIEKFKKFLARITKKALKSLGFRNKGTFLKGKDKIEFIYNDLKKDKAQVKEKKKKQKLPKWDDLKTNRERVRYIYTVFLMRRRKSGSKIEAAKTPYDLSETYAENDEQKKLFEYYCEIRYDENSKPVPGNVIKELLPIIQK